MPNITNDISHEIANTLSDGINHELIPENLFDLIKIQLFQIQNIILSNKLYLTMILVGILLVLIGMYISIYKMAFLESRKKLSLITNIKYLKYIEFITNRFPLKILSRKLDSSIAYFMLDHALQRSIVAIFTILLPTLGILLFSVLKIVLNLWYTRLITLVVCIIVPYYIFTLVVDYMKYSLQLKIPVLIDSFRSSFMMHTRIKPALKECCINTDKGLGRIMLRVSDSRDLNESLGVLRDRMNNTWFNIFILLLVNYRENGGELISQLYKLNRSITRYNNIEKKKNKRLIWYEVFIVSVSVFSLPVILIMNKMILGVNIGLYLDATAAYTKVMLYSLFALLIVRVMRRM